MAVIDSLSDEERGPRNRLVEDLAPLCADQNVGFGTQTAKTPEELLGILRALRTRAREGWKPILHLEMHGCNKRGLQLLPSGRFLPWDQFAGACREIADATDNNFVVVMAVCHGYQAILNVTLGQVTPFTWLIGPKEKVTVGELADSMLGLYRRLLVDGDSLDQARQQLPQKYSTFNCEQTFAAAYAQYVREECRGRGKDARVNQLLTEIARATGDLSKIRKELKRLIKPTSGAFDRFRSRFLLCDRPANRDRFVVSFDDVMQFVDQMVR